MNLSSHYAYPFLFLFITILIGSWLSIDEVSASLAAGPLRQKRETSEASNRFFWPHKPKCPDCRCPPPPKPSQCPAVSEKPAEEDDDYIEDCCREQSPDDVEFVPLEPSQQGQSMKGGKYKVDKAPDRRTPIPVKPKTTKAPMKKPVNTTPVNKYSAKYKKLV